jgi:hypothetical protein
MVMEKVTPVTVIIDEAMVDKTDRAPSGLPVYKKPKKRIASVCKTLSTLTIKNDIEIAVNTISVGINQKLNLKDSQRLMSFNFISVLRMELF